MTWKLTFSHPSPPVSTVGQVWRFISSQHLTGGRDGRSNVRSRDSCQITWTRLKRRSKRQLRRRNTGRSSQERNQHNFVPRVSLHFGRRETLETRLKSETRECARSSSTSSLGFSLVPRGKRERENPAQLRLFVCIASHSQHGLLLNTCFSHSVFVSLIRFFFVEAEYFLS